MVPKPHGVRKQGKEERYDSGCFSCGAKTSSRFRAYTAESVALLQFYNISVMLAPTAESFVACTSCDRCWRRVPQLWKVFQVRKLPTERQVVLIANDPEERDKENLEPNVSVELRALGDSSESGPALGPNSSYGRGLDLLVARPFSGRPMQNVLGFIDHLETVCDKAFSAKAEILGFHKLENLSLSIKLRIVFSICFDIGIKNRTMSHYVKEFMGDLMMDTPVSTRRVLSGLGLVYHPSSECCYQHTHHNGHHIMVFTSSLASS